MLYDGMLLVALMTVATALITLPLGMPHGIYRMLFQLFVFGFIPLSFFSGFWIYGGQTIGMRAWRFKVVTDQGDRLRWGDALKRYLAALLSWLLIGLGFLWVFLDPEKLAWHDRLSKTRLVMVEP
jgi:uncharacterized RDD family membrane protein YckC